MAKAEQATDSLAENLHLASCLLALITERPPNLQEILAKYEDENSGMQKDDPGTDTDVSDELDDDADEEQEEIANITNNSGSDSYLSTLRDKLLDRLAEVLARFKSDAKSKGPRLDAKHVASVMMYYQPRNVKILCAKNEGLDQGKRAEDTNFLDAWSRLMESIASKGRVYC
jgi:hypothetical protein